MKQVRCLICETVMPGSRAEYPDYPFCSVRCRKIDLGRWLGEKYRFPSENQDSFEDDRPDDDES